MPDGARAASTSGGMIRQRSLLWMTPDVQRRVGTASLLVLGAGGTGVLVAVYAAHVGIRKIAVCDPDRLDESNLNRYLIASRADVGRLKVDIIRDYAGARFDDVEVTAIPHAFPHRDAERLLTDADLVVTCVDDVTSRIEADLLARKHRKTLIDLGSGFVLDEMSSGPGNVASAGGQLSISRPDATCLGCLGFELSMRENTYFVGETEPEPSSILLNGVVAAVGVEAVLQELVGSLKPANRIIYDRGRTELTRESVERRAGCPVCGTGRPAQVGEREILFHRLAERGVRCRTS